MPIFLRAVLMLATTSAWADWIKYEEDGEVVFYVDLATIHTSGDFRRVWELQDDKEGGPDGKLSRRLLSEYDCKGERVRILAISGHDGPMTTGKILFNRSNAFPWNYLLSPV